MGIGELFWSLMVVIALGAFLSLFGFGQDKEETKKDDYVDPNVFYYEDLHNHGDNE